MTAVQETFFDPTGPQGVGMKAITVDIVPSKTAADNSEVLTGAVKIEQHQPTPVVFRLFGTVVLGAGAVADDGIYHYKLAFAPTGEVPFVLGRRTLNSEASHRLVAERVAREPGWSARAGWFPAYRA